MGRHFFAKFLMCCFVFVLVLVYSPQCGATPVDGTLTITGDMTLSATTNTFLCDILSAMPCPANSGAFQVTGPATQSGSFVPLALTTGYIQNLNAATNPVNTAFSLPNFITFKASSDIVLNLSFINLGTGGTCPASPCTPTFPALVSPSNPLGLSMYTLTNTANGSTLAFSMSGTARRISTGEISPFEAVFTAQFTNTPGTLDASVANILAEWARNGTLTTSYSATFIVTPPASTVPEPSSLVLFGTSGIALIGAIRRKFQS